MDNFDYLQLHHLDNDFSTRSVEKLKTVLKTNLNKYSDLVIVCIGTDRSVGDSFGPYTGTLLKKLECKANVYGTLEEPVHAMNLEDTIKEIASTYMNPLVIAVDACLGQASSVGKIGLIHGPMKPGAGVKKELPSVGHMHITGIVNVGGFMEYFVLQNTRLSLVVRMAEYAANVIDEAVNSVIQSKKLSVVIGD